MLKKTSSRVLYAMISLCVIQVQAALVSTILVSSLATFGYGWHCYRTTRPVPTPVVREFGIDSKERFVYRNDSGTVVIFCHGLGANEHHVEPYLPLLPGRSFCFNFPDAPKEVGAFRAYTGLAQDGEIQTLVQVLRIVGDDKSVTKIILVGVSRGASTIVNLLKQQDIAHLDKVVGVVLESPFASVDDVIQHVTKSRFFLRFLGHVAVKVMYSRYRPFYNQPCLDLGKSQERAKKIPVCIVCSQEDKLIPAASSERLGKAMQDAGFASVEVHTVPKGQHANILFDKDRESARAAIQAMYSFMQRCMA